MIDPLPPRAAPAVTTRGRTRPAPAQAGTEAFGSLLEAARSGAEWAFSALYRDHNHLLLRYFGSRAPREADDLAAEVWMAAARRLGSFEGDAGAFRAWLFTIAHHRLVQHWRDGTRRPVTTREGLGEVDRPDTGGDPADAVIDAAVTQDALRRITATLSPDQAEVVLLRVLGGLDVGQVAAALHKRPGAVRVLQHRALRKLADQEIFPEGVTP